MVFNFLPHGYEKRIFCIVSALLKRIETETMQKIRFQSRAAKN